MKIKVALRDKKDHFVITIYKKFRKRIRPGDIILFEVNSQELVRMTNKDCHVTIPKKALSKYKGGGVIELKILKVYNKDECVKRVEDLFEKDKANISALVPLKTIFGKEIYILDRGDWICVWYSIGGGARPINIKKKINAEELAELIGFYYGDGSTSERIRSFRLNNCEPSVLNYTLNILYKMGISKNWIKAQIIYSSNKALNSRIIQRCINFWSKKLGLKKGQVVSVNRSKNKRESLKYGSCRIFIDNSVLVEIMLYGILKKFIEIVKNPKRELEMEITRGFLRGLLAAEGCPIVEKGSLRKVGISFNPHSGDLELYKKILENLNIYWKFIHGNEIVIHKFENFKKLFELDAFKLHEERNKKFLSGFKNHKYFNTKF